MQMPPISDQSVASTAHAPAKELDAHDRSQFAAQLSSQMGAKELPDRSPTRPVEVARLVDDRFNRFDVDGDGQITLGSETMSRHPLLRAADNAGDGDGSVTRAELESFVSSFDRDQSGTLSLAERVSMHAVSAHIARGSFAIQSFIDHRFSHLDDNGDGQIALDSETRGSHSVLRAADSAGNGDGLTTVDELMKLLGTYDEDGNGTLSASERGALLHAVRHPMKAAATDTGASR